MNLPIRPMVGLQGRLFAAVLLVASIAAPRYGAQVLIGLQRGATINEPTIVGVQARFRAAEQRVVQAKAGLGPTAAQTASSSDKRYCEALSYETRPLNGSQTALQTTQHLHWPALFASLDGAQDQFEQVQAAAQQVQA